MRELSQGESQGLYFVITVSMITTYKGSSLKGSWIFAEQKDWGIGAKPNILIITDFIQLSPTACGGAPFQKGAFCFVLTIKCISANFFFYRRVSLPPTPGEVDCVARRRG